MPVQSDIFKYALGHFASGVTVVTFGRGDMKAGLTVSAFSSVSLDPPFILVCIHKNSASLNLFQREKIFAVNFLAAGQEQISNQFASRTADKFHQVIYTRGNFDVPILEGTLGYLECAIVNQFTAGDHDIFIGQVEHAEIDETKQPLLYYHSTYGQFLPEC